MGLEYITQPQVFTATVCAVDLRTVNLFYTNLTAVPTLSVLGDPAVVNTLRSVNTHAQTVTSVAVSATNIQTGTVFTNTITSTNITTTSINATTLLSSNNNLTNIFVLKPVSTLTTTICAMSGNGTTPFVMQFTNGLLTSLTF
jgi:hypothetical protein